MQTSRTDNTLKLATTLFLLLGSWLTFYVEPNDSKVNWNTTEWLINYADGFVRRGFWGSILQNSGIPTSSMIEVLSFITFFIAMGVIVLSFRIFNKLKRLKNTIKNDFYLWILSPSLIGFYFLNSATMRKDLLFILCILIQLNALIKTNVPKSRIRKFSPLILTAFMSIILALSHEGITLFLWLPFSFFISCLYLQSVTQSLWRGFWLTISAFSPAIVVILISVYFHGDQHTSFLICESWKPLLTRDCSSDYNNLSAISALGWDVKYGMSIPRGIILSPLIIVWLALIIFWGMANLLLSMNYNTLKLENKLILYWMLLTTSLPFYIIGEDFGRWFVLSSITFILLNASLPLIGLEDDVNSFIEAVKNKIPFVQKILEQGVFSNFANVFTNLFNSLLGKILFVSLGLPACCIGQEGIFASSLVGFSYNLILQGIGGG
jgi:hypothetical protein